MSVCRLYHCVIPGNKNLSLFLFIFKLCSVKQYTRLARCHRATVSCTMILARLTLGDRSNYNIGHFSSGFFLALCPSCPLSLSLKSYWSLHLSLSLSHLMLFSVTCWTWCEGIIGMHRFNILSCRLVVVLLWCENTIIEHYPYEIIIIH